jgi:hypothetical protein
MGRSDPCVFSFYKKHIKPKGSVALLGWTDNSQYEGDLYDLQLKNWDINSDWSLKKKYDTIICTRTAYFAKDPELFISKCYDHLNERGTLYADWGLGDHWRFPDFKVGWVKNNEHEWAYQEGNFLWSTAWSDKLLDNKEIQTFSQEIKALGYHDIKKAIKEEIPEVLSLESIGKYFHVTYNILQLGGTFTWGAKIEQIKPQLYILISGKKNEPIKKL